MLNDSGIKNKAGEGPSVVQIWAFESFYFSNRNHRASLAALSLSRPVKYGPGLIISSGGQMEAVLSST